MFYGVEVMRRHGFLIALSVPESWNELYRTQVLFRGTSPRAFFAGGFVKIWGPSVLLFGALTALCRVRVLNAWRKAALVLLFAGGVLFFLHTPREDLAALVPAAFAILLIESFTARRLAAICVALVAVVAAARQPFFLRNATYGAFTAPLAIAVSVGWLGRRARARQAFALFLSALAAFHVFHDARDRHAFAHFDAAGVHIRLPAAEARFVAAAVAAIEKHTPEGAYVASFPEAGCILFASRRRHPFVDTTFYPGGQDAVAEEAMIRRLREAPVAAVLVTNRHFPEYGPGTYGNGVLDRFFAVLEREYGPPIVIGDDGGVPPAGSRATMGWLYVRRPSLH